MHTSSPMDSPTVTLISLLGNDLILRQMGPYLGIQTLLSLLGTSRAIRGYIQQTLQVFGYVDLSVVRACGRPFWSPNRIPDGRKHDTLYARSLLRCMNILIQQGIWQHIRILVLDGMIVSSDILQRIIVNTRVEVLSIIRAGPSRAILDGLRPGQPSAAYALKAVYVCGVGPVVESQGRYDCHNSHGVMDASGAQLGTQVKLRDTSACIVSQDDPYIHSPYANFGCVSSASIGKSKSTWTQILDWWKGMIAFNVVLCPHELLHFSFAPKLAHVRLSGCQSCGSCPEGPAIPGRVPEHRLPLLHPPSLRSTKVADAQCIRGIPSPYPPLIVRCHSCLTGRWCESCNAWWCETCYTIPHTGTSTGTESEASPFHTSQAVSQPVKIVNGLCVARCLREEMLNGAGEGGMWG